jgi:hypothetical protein
MFQDLSEKEIRKVVDPLPPSVLLYEIEQAYSNWNGLAQCSEQLFSTFGKRAQVLLGFREIGVWTADGPLVQGGKGAGRRFDHQESDLLLAARLLEEKGLLEHMQLKDPGWYVGALELAQEKQEINEAVAA